MYVPNKYLDIQIFTPPSPSPKEMKVASSFLLPLPRFRGGGGGASTILHRIPASVCAQCRHRRAFSSVAARYSGHNRWSKIRHEKGAADQKKTAQRSVFAKHLTLYSKRASLLAFQHQAKHTLPPVVARPTSFPATGLEYLGTRHR